MSVDAVLFDWGGTLTTSDLGRADLLDLWRLAAHHLEPAREDELVSALAAIDQRFWDRTTTTLESWRLADILQAASDELGLDVTDAVLEEAATRHLDGWTQHIRHEPDAAEVLQALRARGLRIGMLSNTNWPRSFHEHFLERDGLARLIDARLYTSDLGYVKPHPSVFIDALAAVGLDDPTRAVFVGDRPYDDIHGAQRVGMRTVLRVSTVVPPYDVEPDAEIGTLSELLALIDRWRDPNTEVLASRSRS
ncbi:MAG TPA: HAD family hydrolase [Acidimicrobiales bacterium]